MLAAGLILISCSDGDSTAGRDPQQGSSTVQDDPDASGALAEPLLTTRGLGPIELGRTFPEIASSTGVELTFDACDYRIGPGGYLNVIFETADGGDGAPRLVGIYVYHREDLQPSLTPHTDEDVGLGTSADEVLNRYPDATVIGQERGGEYWLLDEDGPANQLVAFVEDDAVVGLGAGNSGDLMTPNCS